MLRKGVCLTDTRCRVPDARGGSIAARGEPGGGRRERTNVPGKHTPLQEDDPRSEQADFNDQTQETKDRWATAVALASMPRQSHPVGGQQVDTPLLDVQRAYQALDLDEQTEFLLWLVRGAPGVW